MPTFRSVAGPLLADIEATLSALGDQCLATSLGEHEVKSRASLGADYFQIELRPRSPVSSVLPMKSSGKRRSLYLPLSLGTALLLFDAERRALGLEIMGRTDLATQLDRAGVPATNRLPFA